MTPPDYTLDELIVRQEMFSRLIEHTATRDISRLAGAEALYRETIDDFNRLADPGGEL